MLTPFLSRRFVALAVATALLPGCGRTADAPPPASFLVIAGDSTFWVESDGESLGMRRSALMVAHVDGAYHELYIADQDLSYYDALMVGQRVWRRDLLSGDSVLVRYDSSIAVIAQAYAARHPREEPIGPDEETAEDPTTQATTDTELLDVVGPYLSYEFHLDVDIHGERDQHVTQRGVVDIRDGRRLRLEDLMAPVEAARAYAEGQARFSAALDSIRKATDDRAIRARPMIGGLSFDSTSFELLDADRIAAVAFLAPGRGPRAGGYALPLGEIPIEPASWWNDVLPALPTRSDEMSASWADSAYDVAVQADSGGTVARLEVRRGNARWSAGTVPLPVRRVFRVSLAPADRDQHRALQRAFDEVEAYGGVTQTSSSTARPGRPPTHGPRRVSLATRYPRQWKQRPPVPAKRSSPTS